MKNKMVKLIMLTAVLLALTNIAAAVIENMTIVEDGTNVPVTGDITLSLGESKVYDILISDIILVPQGYEHIIGIRLKDQNGNPTTGIRMEISEKTSPYGSQPNGIWESLLDNPVVKWAQDNPPPGASERLDLIITEIAGTPNNYTLEILDGVTTIGVFHLLSKDSVDVNAIPEFPTVALPIAGTIGMLLFLQNRKKK